MKPYPSWYGNGSEASNITGNGKYTLSTSGNNMQIRLQRPTTFTFKTDTKELTVATDDTDYNLDYFSATQGTYNNETHTLTTTESWKGINLWVGDVANTQNEVAMVETDKAVKLGWYINYNSGDGESHNEEEQEVHYTIAPLTMSASCMG